MAAAQYKLGLMHENGRGVPKDLAEAEKWYGRAAEQGYSGAQYNLGFVHYSQDDIAGTTEWWSRAAEGGDEQRSEEHTSELQSLMRISYAVFCLNKKKTHTVLRYRN